MTPKKTTVEGERDELHRDFCDQVIYRAAKLMIEDRGAPMEMMIDRLLTFAGAHICTSEGAPRAAQVFRQLADNIDAGVFHSLTVEKRSGGKGH